MSLYLHPISLRTCLGYILSLSLSLSITLPYSLSTEDVRLKVRREKDKRRGKSNDMIRETSDHHLSLVFFMFIRLAFPNLRIYFLTPLPIDAKRTLSKKSKEVSSLSLFINVLSFSNRISYIYP